MIKHIDKYSQEALDTRLTINGRALYTLDPKYLYSGEEIIVQYPISVRNENNKNALLDGMIFVTNVRCIVRLRSEFAENNMEFAWHEDYSLHSGNTAVFKTSSGKFVDDVEILETPYFRLEYKDKSIEFFVLRRKKVRKNHILKIAGFLEYLVFYRTFSRIRNIHFSNPDKYTKEYKAGINYEELYFPSGLKLLLLPLFPFIVLPLAAIVGAITGSESAITILMSGICLLGSPLAYILFFVLGTLRKKKAQAHRDAIIEKYLGEIL